MESGQSSPNEGERPVSAISKQRACDECRTRKIRCDRRFPCAHCRAANLTCRTTNERPKERKARVIISKEYEHKIDGIESRLAGIEDLLRTNIAELRSTHQSQSPSKNGTTGQSASDGSVVDETPSDPAPFSGFTGPNADSILAQEVVEQTVGGNPVALRDESLRTALHSLGQIVSKMKVDATEPLVKPSHSVAASPSAEPLLPDWNEVQALLTRAQHHSSATFILSFPSMTLVEFSQKCQELYEHPQSCPHSRRLLVYTGLYWFAAEFSALDAEPSANYHAALSKRFHDLVLRTLTNFPLILPAHLEAVEALMAGSCFAIDICKPSLSQTLTSAAVRLCQTLGYHRSSTMVNDSKSDKDRKTMLFWFVYLTDKMISLRLGHASAIQDFEITVPKPEPSETYSASLVYLVNYWVDVGRIQGQIAEQLYSPAALMQPSDVRTERAEKLALDLQQAYEIRVEANESILALFSMGGANASSIAEELIGGGDTIMHYSTLTSILHAIPVAQPGVSRAVEAARAALQASPDMSQYENRSNYFWVLYCHWITLNTPLTPFTVLFCHIIANYKDCDDDLRLLERFIRSLYLSRNVSEGTQRLYQLCSVFGNVARAYVHVKTQEARNSQDNSNGLATNTNQSIGPPILGDFDEYLSALGLAPQPTHMGAAELSSSGFQMDEDMSNYLSDWYSGGASLYGLLEHDLGNIAGLDYPVQDL